MLVYSVQFAIASSLAMTGGEKAGSFSKFNFLNTQIFLNITLMVMQRGGCVYIITNKNNSVLYTGVTSDIIGRIFDHKNKTYPQSFTAKYNCNKLVYYLFYSHIEEAIAAEKALKGGNRQMKVKLVNELNPEWRDLYDDLIKD